MLKSKKFLSVILTVMMLVQTLVVPSFAAEVEQFTDFPANSWSTEAMTAAVENGLITGTSETTIEPAKNLTRAEFAAIITRAFGATKTADISKFKDVIADDWFYDSVAKAVQMGVMNGTGETSFDPNAPMKREDVILSLARVLFVDGTDASVLNQFSDRNEIDTWAVAGIAGMVSEGYVNGYEDETIRPKSYITREELAQLFHNMFKTYISAEGEYTSVAQEGSVIIRSKGVTLRDVTINGDLVIADGVGDGDFRLTNVTVKGKILARGGEGTVYFTNVKADGKVIINDPNGTVNFHNYRDEAPFVNNLTENTPATFLERKVHGSSATGGSSKFTLAFYALRGDTDPVKSIREKSGYIIQDSDVPTDAEMEIPGKTFKGWTKGVDVYGRDYFIGKKITAVRGNWYAVYVDDFSVSFKYVDGTEALPTVSKQLGDSEDYILTENDVKDVENNISPDDYEFLGWTETVDGTDYKSSAELRVSIKSLDGKTYYAQFNKITDNYSVAFKYTDGSEALPTVTKTLAPSEDYTLTATDVKDVEYHTNPDDYEFLGWTETVDGTDYKTSASLQASLKSLDGKTYYAQFEKLTDDYSVAFKYTDGSEALPTVTKTLAPSEDYTLTATDVKDVEYHTNPGDYEFLGWTDTVDGTDYKTSAELQTSIKSLDGKTYYAQFDKLDDTYKVTFLYTNGAEALAAVEKTLAPSEDYTLTDADVKDVEHYDEPEMYEFLGWTETVDGTDYKSSAELQVSIKTLDGKTYYAQFKHIDSVLYVVEHRFEQLDGTYVVDDAKTQEIYEFPGIDVTAEALTGEDLPEGYTENTAHPDRVAEGTVLPEDDANYPLTLVLYYDLDVLTVTYHDMWWDDPDTPEVESAIPDMTYEVKYGGTIENFYDPADSSKTNEEIQEEIFEYLVSEVGYLKSYDNAYLFNEFQPENDDGLHEHEIKYHWYVEDDVEQYVLYDENKAVTEDLDVFMKLKKLNIVISFPDKLTDEVLTINVPYEDSTRFVDSLRDALFVNSNIADFPEMTGVEDLLYEKLADVEKGGNFFEGGSALTDEYELNDIHTLVRFSQLMGEDNFEAFLNSFIVGNQDLMKEIEEKLIAYIKGADHEATAAQLKELVDALIVEHEEDAHELVDTLIRDLIADESGVKLLEEFMIEYVTTLVESDEQADKDMLEHLEAMLCDMFASYRDKDPDAFKSFVVTTIVDSLSSATPSATIKAMIGEYIDEKINAGEFDDEIANGDFDTQIYNYIMDMEHEDFIEKVEEVRTSNPTIVDDIINGIDEATKDAKIKEKLSAKLLGTETADVDFRATVIDKAFELNDSSIDAQIKDYVKNYNLAEEYIENNKDTYIRNYILDTANRDYIFSQITDTMWESIATGASSLSENEKRDALNTYINDETDAAVQLISDNVDLSAKLDMNKMVDDYFASNRDTVKGQMKTKLNSDGNLRTEFASYILNDTNYAKIKPYINDEIEDAKDTYIEEYLDQYLVDLGKPENEADKIDLVNTIISYVRSDSSIITGAVGSDVIVDFVVKDIADNENDDDPATESEYVGYIKDYVDTLDDGDPDTSSEFANIVNKLIHAETYFRNDIIVTLFEELYHDEADPEHEILIGFMTKVTDDMIATGEIELGVLEMIVEYVNEPEHGDELVHDIVEVLLQVDNIIDFATEHLGVVDNTGKLDAANKFKNEVTKEEKFEVTEANLFIMELVDEKVRSMTFDAFLDDFVSDKVPETLLNKLPLYIVEDIYNESINGFIDDLEAAIAEVEGGSTEPQYVDSGVVVDFNAVTDLFIPMMDYAKDAHEKAVDKAVASGNKAAGLIEKYYIENPYVVGDTSIGNKGVVNYGFDYNLYIDDSDSDGLYTIKSFKELYEGIAMPMSVESVDALLWMMDAEGGNVPEDRIRNLAVENKDLILALYNHPNALMKRYAEEGLPEDMTEYYDDLLENDEIREAVEKLDNKVDFDMMFFVEEKLQNKTLEMYFLKVLDRAGVKVEEILDLYTGSKAYKEFTEEQFDKIVEEIGNWWGEHEVTVDGEKLMVENGYGTTDYVFDTFFEKIAGKDNTADISVKGFEMTVTRFFADDLYQTAPEN